jgi:hypothetical protein
MANPDYGYCRCPICSNARAALRIAANGKAYISCDNCVSNIRTLSSVGDKAMRAMMTERAAGGDAPPPAPAAPVVDTPPPAPAVKKAPGRFADALDVLTGGGK